MVAVAWGLGLLIFPILSALAAPHIERLDLPEHPGGVVQSLVLLMIGLVANGALFFIHINGAFLTWRTAARPFLVTLFMLQLWCGIVVGIWLMWNGTVALAALNGRPIDGPLTAACAVAAVGALLALLLVSEFWKDQDDDVVKVREARTKALALYPAVSAGKSSAEERDRFVQLLKTLNEEAKALEARLTEPDRTLAGKWRKAAKRLYDAAYGYEASKPFTETSATVAEDERLLKLDYP